jgi:predicted phage-related endonuclease
VRAKVLARVTPDHHFDKWKAIWRRSVSSSDLPILVLGEQYGKTPLDLWMQKKGRVPDLEQTNLMEQGKLREPLAVAQFAKATGRKVVRPVATYCHPKHRWMVSNPDGLICANGDGLGTGVLEIKSPHWSTFLTWLKEGLSAAHVIQTQWHMLIRGARFGYLMGYHPDFEEPLLYRAEPDLALQQHMVKVAAKFRECVVNDTLPPDEVEPVEVKMPPPVLKRGVWSEDPVWRAAMARLRHAVKAHKEAKLQAAIAKEALDRAAADVQFLMGDEVEEISTPWGGALWRWGKTSEKLDAKKVQAKYPDVYRDCLVIKPAKRNFTPRVKGV